MSVSVKTIKIALLGLGTVGRGVYRMLQENSRHIGQRVGANIEIKKILVRDMDKDRGIDIDRGLLTTDINEIINDPEIDIVVEVMGGITKAREILLQVLNKGVSVVTANKDLLALHGKELYEASEKNGCDLLFEASVAGGIPIISTLKRGLAGNSIQQVFGIINGTTNYMLTKMAKDGSDFNEVLKEAQEKGYAESDPTADVGGFDAARKIAILASIAFNTRVTINDVYVEGITKITAEDINFAKEFGYAIKLLGIAKNTEDGIEVRVHPTLIQQDHPLAAVNDVFNAVFISGDAVGDTMFYGQGAGELPTASAVVADIMESARNINNNVSGIIGCTCYDNLKIKPISESKSRFYLRMLVTDKPGVLASIALVFGNKNVSMWSMIQKGKGVSAELVLITHKTKEENINDALCDLRQIPCVKQIANMIRVEG